MSTEKRAEQPTTPISILLVDDEPLHLNLLEASLHGSGLRVVKVGSGAEAVRRAAEEDFALILLDVVMPGMDGFGTAAKIRQQRRSRDTPIIFLTAHMNTMENALAGYRAGAVDYVVKPVDARVLQAKAAVFARLFERLSKLRQDSTCLEESHRELQEVVMEIGGSRDALCICERCKKFRDPSGRWIPLEEYLHEHLGADVCLGVLCPDCAEQRASPEKNQAAAFEARAQTL